MYYKTKAVITFLLTSIVISSFAADPVKINIRQADSIFLEKNYLLLASTMNIEAQKALILQAKLYPNPTFSLGFVAYDPENKKALHIGSSGQKTAEIEQLLLLGGKRKAEIEMAKTNASIAEIEFQKLVRELRFKLYSNLFNVGQQKKLLAIYDAQLNLLDELLESNTIQVRKGNLPAKDLVRLKGAYLKLNNSKAELFKDYLNAQGELQTILHLQDEIIFDFSDADFGKYIKSIGLPALTEEMNRNQPELLLLEKDKVLAQQYLTYQRKLAIPDLSISANYDQQGSVFKNEIGTGISLSLPFWNRNQGNIKAGTFKLKESEYQFKALESELHNKLRNSYTFYRQTVSEYQKAKKLYDNDFEETLKGMNDNFKKRNVSIIEFLDFFEAYNDALTELARIKTQLVDSAQELNLLTGKDIY
ncbi:outer membrane efflux protein [Pseudopedobacter saltans DSM 12145]|uniref:Outer membrane efflux protein n=1 Tax=Pseudopedobacter saltans (strain ATCC 51119 / DSM 12145 / JCM 21818 / CCUG 39354 / LMG 10337 / NBRC 100064 / NCIMB 13643) TaxID=762903 RepID=F0S6R8_PSESL|nr:TolC family protein [Pseudopedobacter saltans]ADY52178.1 outer membrane efflux protein [Pseudopedobacter saltans DSM 12145]